VTELKEYLQEHNVNSTISAARFLLEEANERGMH
jgi:hypothetical protein